MKFGGTGAGPEVPPPTGEELGLSLIHAKCCRILGLISIIGDIQVPNPLQVWVSIKLAKLLAY